MIAISYITCRPEPRFDWFFQSLAAQLRPEDETEIIIVDFYAQACDGWNESQIDSRSYKISEDLRLAFSRLTNSVPKRCRYKAPKPTVWAGPNRLTKDNWWHASDARNTALCLARGDWWVCVDDRCVLLPGWMDAVRDAVKGGYAICGPYQKRTGITVENGIIRHAGIVTGEDNRLDYVNKHYAMHESLKNPYSAPGEWWYGCTTCLPTEWALKVNGYDETCDSSSGEDYIFGLMLQNNGFEIRFDTRFSIVEDRTPEFIGPPMHRKDKGHSPNDKSHALLAKLRGLPRAQHPWDLRAIRQSVLNGGAWPKATWPVTDWYDGEPLHKFMP